jgi:hypothetical protein
MISHQGKARRSADCPVFLAHDLRFRHQASGVLRPEERQDSVDLRNAQLRFQVAVAKASQRAFVVENEAFQESLSAAIGQLRKGIRPRWGRSHVTSQVITRLDWSQQPGDLAILEFCVNHGITWPMGLGGVRDRGIAGPPG